MLHKFIIRISHSIPGILLITGLTSPIWLSLSFPRVFGNFVVIFAVYWLHRAIIFIVGVSVGYYRYHTSLQKNWLDECTSLVTDSLPDHETLPKTISTHSKILPKHLIVIPIGGTSLQSIKRTLIALKNQNYPASLVYISLSFEETFTKKDNHTYKQIIDEVERLFGKNNKNVMLFTHPNNLEHEVPGAASNRSWGNSQAVKVLEQKKEDLSNFITTSPD
ncbi:hypothetical protein KC717_00635, partial [Candidatus Dojkabacteria bacterium]|nr:hypothetical protein [Candidatus Dojkabacteria bacterium]